MRSSWPHPGDVHPACAKAVKNANQSVLANTGTPINFNYVEYDLPGAPPMWSSGTPARLVAPTQGVYHAIGNASFAVQLGGFRLFYLIHNGILKTINSVALAGGGFYTGEVVASDINMAAGDYVELWVYHNHTAALNIDVAGNCFLSLRLLFATNYIDYAGS